MTVVPETIVAAVGITKSRARIALELMERLCPDDGSPASPDEAAAMIVADLLGDLPIGRQDRIKNIIEYWGVGLVQDHIRRRARRHRGGQ